MPGIPGLGSEGLSVRYLCIYFVYICLFTHLTNVSIVSLSICLSTYMLYLFMQVHVP